MTVTVVANRGDLGNKGRQTLMISCSRLVAASDHLVRRVVQERPERPVELTAVEIPYGKVNGTNARIHPDS